MAAKKYLEFHLVLALILFFGCFKKKEDFFFFVFNSGV